MSRSEGLDRPAIDWRGWLALAWIVVFGAIYALMIVREKAPWLLDRLSGRR